MNNIKKIATITFHNSYNYGSVLQAFALQTYLKKIGYETKIIDFLEHIYIYISLNHF